MLDGTVDEALGWDHYECRTVPPPERSWLSDAGDIYRNMTLTIDKAVMPVQSYSFHTPDTAVDSIYVPSDDWHERYERQRKHNEEMRHRGRQEFKRKVRNPGR